MGVQWLWKAFDGKGEWNFGNDFARNATILGANNSSSSHTDNQENKVLVLAEGSTSVLREALVHQRKSLVLTLVKQWQNFA